jgi:hypothetical protein
VDNVDDARVREVLLRRFGLRVHPQMGRFVLGQLADPRQVNIPVMAGDARTGVAIRQLLSADELRASLHNAATA